MPLALSPNQTCKIVLRCDRDKPVEEQPYFIYRFLTGAECLEIADRQDRLDTVKSNRQAIRMTYQSAATGLVGWGNMIDPKTKQEIPFDANGLPKVAGIADTQELIVRISMQTPDYEDKKKSDLPSASDTVKSAENVPV